VFCNSGLQLAELNENTDALQAEQEAREKHRSEMEKEKLDKQVVLQRLNAERSSNASRIAELKAHLEEAKKLVDLREGLKTKREAARATRLELHNEKKTLEIELASIKELAAKAKAEDFMVEESMREVDVLRQQNDETQAKQVLPGEREYESLLQQEIELKSLLGDAQNDPTFIDLKITIDNLQQRLDDVKKECSEYSAEQEKKKMEKDELDAKAESHQNSISAEIQGLQEELSAVQEDNAEVENSINGLRRKIHDKSGGKELALLKQKLRIYQQGADLLKLTAKKEKRILNHDSDHFD
jgi:predicted  nucleic acid-binding Zn-ribbon protein